MSLKLNCIAAMCENMGIGKNNNLPWRLKSEMEYFTKMTSDTRDKSRKNVVIMGRRTWDSIPKKYKPLSNRINFVISRSDLNLDNYQDSYAAKSLDEIIERLKGEAFQDRVENIWVVGGSTIYAEAMKSPLFYRLYLTKIHKTFDCDIFFPELPKSLKKISLPEVPNLIQKENEIEFEYNVYENMEYNEE